MTYTEWNRRYVVVMPVTNLVSAASGHASVTQKIHGH